MSRAAARLGRTSRDGAATGGARPAPDALERGARLRRLGALLAGAAASAALFALAMRLDARLAGLVLVAFVPLLAALERAERLAEAVLAGVAAAVLVVAFAGWWFPGAVAGFTGWPAPAAWVAVLALAAPVIQPQLPIAAAAAFLARGRARGAAFALAWVGAEWAVPKLLGDTAGLALQPVRVLRQAADLAGTAGLTLLALAANVLVLAALRSAVRAARGRARWRAAAVPAAALGALLAAWAAYGAERLQSLAAAPRGAPVVVGVVQSAITRYDALARERGTYAVVREVLDVHEALSRELVARDRAQFLVWPETVYPTTFGAPQSEEGAELDREIAAFAAEQGVPLAFGAYEAEGGREYNAAFFLSPAERAVASYRKANLFPFTERVPALLDFPWVRRLLPWTGGWTPGPGPRTVGVTVGGRRLAIAPLVCYDAVQPAHAAAAARAGAGLLLALSNDAWFAGGPGPRLHLAAAAMRAVETRLPLVRATTSGISGLVDASGEVRVETPEERRAAVALPVVPGPALAAPFPWIGGALGPAAAALAGALALRPRRAGSRPASRPADRG